MSSGKTWVFHIPETYNKDLPADLQPVANFCTWRVSDVAHGCFSLFGLVQLKQSANRAFLRQYLPTGHLNLSSLAETRSDFYPLYGGYVITFGAPKNYIKEDTTTVASSLRRIHTNGSTKKLQQAASDPKQTQLSLSRLAAAEMGFEL